MRMSLGACGRSREEVLDVHMLQSAPGGRSQSISCHFHMLKRKREAVTSKYTPPLTTTFNYFLVYPAAAAAAIIYENRGRAVCRRANVVVV